MSDEFVRVSSIEEVAPGTLKVVKANGRAVCLINLDGTVHALSAVCTHAGCDFGEDGEVDGDELECMCHGSRFDIATGDVTSPPARTPLKRFTVKVENNEILVALSG